MAYLILADKHSEFDRRELSGPTVIGRAVDCDIPVRDILLSRRHCRLDPLGDRWVVADLGSKNGTRVDGKPVEKHVLRDGEVIRAGNIRICFKAGAFEPAPPDSDSRRREARPIDPIEALSGTVMGFSLSDMQEESEISGFPIPKPKPAEPAAYVRENVHGMVRSLATAPAVKSAPRARPQASTPAQLAEKDQLQHALMLVQPRATVAKVAAETLPVPIRRTIDEPKPRRAALRNPDPNTSATIPRWLAWTYIGLACVVCALSLTVLAFGWITAARAQ